MGCDIHFHTEVKTNGKWEHYSHPRIDRSYWFFTLLCNVRQREGVEPFLKEPNYIWPDDLSIVTYNSLHLIDNGYHSLCTFDSETISRFYKHIENIKRPPKEYPSGNVKSFSHQIEWDWVGYLDGHSWDIVRYPNDKPKWIEDVRWIFAFDN